VSEKQVLKLRAAHILRSLKRIFPEVKMALNYKNNWELMVAVQLSAQCTDKKVNEITPRLFARYRKLKDYVDADPKEFEQLIFQTGFYRNKTKNILAAAKVVQKDFAGKLPNTMKEMLTVPGVARKTANVVLGNAYGISEGIAVDTHVKRLTRLFHLTKRISPVHIEQELMKLYPKKEWFLLTYYFIEFGRKYCPAKMHDHARCMSILGIKD
jgi:endonuclease-3